MKFIVDTSVWIEHLKSPVSELVELLAEKKVLCHTVVIGELSCGNMKRRHEILGNLKILPKAKEASFEETLELIELEKLYGKGLGFSDVQILASALLSDTGIFTFDHALISATKTLKLQYIHTPP